MGIKVRLRRPRPLLRAAVELVHALNAFRPLGRKGYATFLAFWFGWRTTEVPLNLTRIHAKWRRACVRAGTGQPRSRDRSLQQVVKSDIADIQGRLPGNLSDRIISRRTGRKALQRWASRSTTAAAACT